MKTVRQSLGYLIAGILLFFLIKPFVLTHAELKDVTLEVQWEWLIASFGLHLLYRSLYPYPFATLLRGLTGKQVSFRAAFTLFHLANITRYLPGRIWGVVRLLSLSPRFGLSKTAVGSALTSHVGIETALGGLIGVSLLLSPKMQETALGMIDKISGHTAFLSLACIGVLIGTLFLIPKVATHARAFLKTLTSLKQHPKICADVITGHVLLWICQGFAFFLFVKSFAPVAWRDAFGLTACFAFAWIVGFLSFLTPGGLGIREGLLGVLLSSYMPTTQATFLALVCRLWMLTAEILLALIAFFLHRSCYERQNDAHNL